MKKLLLTASVTALAIAAPAQAEREGRGQRAEQGQQAEREQARPQRAERQQQARPQMQRTERAQPRPERAERAQAWSQRVERAESRPQRAERPIQQQAAQERRALRQQEVSSRRAMQQQAQAERRARTEQAQSSRRAQQQQAQSERRSRIEQVQPNRGAERQQAQSDRRSRIQQVQSDRRAQTQQIQSDRQSRFQQAQSDRRSRFQQIEPNRQSRVEQLQSDRRTFAGDDRQWRQQLWERRAERQRGLAELRERRAARLQRYDGDERDFLRVGQRVDSNWWYDDYVPLRYRASFDDDDRYYYRYDGDYLYRLNRDDNVVLSLFPVLGGAYSVGRQMPFYQSSYYNVPLGYSSFYYDRPDAYYRYGDGAIYGIDPTTQLITGIVALLTGQNLGIGQMLPMGYDVYNVPYAYRSSYQDSDDMWWRYDDGYLYGVDPYSRMIEQRVPVYGGYMVGNQWPSYAGYGYDVPDYYGDLYYDAPGYDYRYASGGIYQVDPKTQLIAALAALVTGQNFNVGQALPLGYDVYNVPFAYRDDYYDDDDNWYRYADGRILQVDPDTRVIRRVILV